jgi:outer membrane lipoprotein-sorting protein
VKKTIFAFAAVLFAASALPHPALAADALAQALEAFSKVTDYTADIVVHEVKGTDVRDNTYHYQYLKPNYVKLDVTAGPGRGSGAVWTGGDQVSGHMGGILSGLHKKVGLHDGQAESLRGDAIDSGTIPAMLAQFKDAKGTVTEIDDKTVDGILTDELSLKPADPAALGGVTRVDLYLSHATHMPVRRERFVGDQLVKSEQVTNQKINTGLKPSDFPF